MGHRVTEGICNMIDSGNSKNETKPVQEKESISKEAFIDEKK